MSDKLLTIYEWEDQYGAVLEFDHDTLEESGILFFETYGDELQDLKDNADDIAKDNDSKRYQHIWTRVDGDNGKLILLNGWHACNRLDYCISSFPWGDGTDADKDVYIEVKYED